MMSTTTSPSEIKKIKEIILKIQNVINKQGKYGYYLLMGVFTSSILLFDF
jgi:hypothetical protein